jgi:hypothetical protein
MPAISQTKAAEAHESAAKTHRTAAEHRQKRGHKAGLVHSEKATKLSETVQEGLQRCACQEQDSRSLNRSTERAVTAG